MNALTDGQKPSTKPRRINASMLTSFMELVSNTDSALNPEDEARVESDWQNFNRMMEFAASPKHKKMFTDDFFEHPEYRRIKAIKDKGLLQRKTFARALSEIDGEANLSSPNQVIDLNKLSHTPDGSLRHPDLYYYGLPKGADGSRAGEDLTKLIGNFYGADNLSIEENGIFQQDVFAYNIARGRSNNEHAVTNFVQDSFYNPEMLPAMGYVLVQGLDEGGFSSFINMHDPGTKLRKDYFASHVSRITGYDTVQAESIAASMYFDALIEHKKDTATRINSLSSSEKLKEYRRASGGIKKTYDETGDVQFRVYIGGNPNDENNYVPVNPFKEDDPNRDGYTRTRTWYDPNRVYTIESYEESIRNDPESGLGSVHMGDMDQSGMFAGNYFDDVFTIEQNAKEHFMDTVPTKADLAMEAALGTPEAAAMFGNMADVIGDDVILVDGSIPLEEITEALTDNIEGIYQMQGENLGASYEDRKRFVTQMFDDRGLMTYLSDAEVRMELASSTSGRNLLASYEKFLDKVNGKSSGSVIIDSAANFVESVIDHSAYELNINNPDTFYELFGHDISNPVSVSTLLRAMNDRFESLIDRGEMKIDSEVASFVNQGREQGPYASPHLAIAALSFRKGVELRRETSVRGEAFRELIRRNINNAYEGGIDDKYKIIPYEPGNFENIWNNGLEPMMDAPGVLNIGLPQGDSKTSVVDLLHSSIAKMVAHPGAPLTEVALGSNSVRYRVTHAVDADTIMVMTEDIGNGEEISVRLHSIDAPEIWSKKEHPEYRHGHVGRQLIQHLIESDEYTVMASIGITDKYGNEKKQDHFSRDIGRMYIYDKDGKYIGLASELLVRSGLARYVQTFNSGFPEVRDRMIDHQAAAREEGLGVWE